MFHFLCAFARLDSHYFHHIVSHSLTLQTLRTMLILSVGVRLGQIEIVSLYHIFKNNQNASIFQNFHWPVDPHVDRSRLVQRGCRPVDDFLSTGRPSIWVQKFESFETLKHVWCVWLSFSTPMMILSPLGCELEDKEHVLKLYWIALWLIYVIDACLTLCAHLLCWLIICN